jgi:cytochrome c556
MMMEESITPVKSPVASCVFAFAVAALTGGAGIGYAVYEHHGAQMLAAKNAQVKAQLNSKQGELDFTQAQLQNLSAKVDELAANAQSQASAATAANRTAAAHRAYAEESHFKKLQTQLDAQNQAIDQARTDLTSTQGDLSNTRTELTGSIAKTHDELVSLEKRGERSYFEFDIDKSKHFKHEGPIGIRLGKANSKKGYADLMLIVDDRNLQQKHVNLYQPAMFYQPDSPQPVEIVIYDISKDHIHGYVSAPRYKQSELASNEASNVGTDSGIVTPGSGSNSDTQPAARKKLPLPTVDPDTNQQ